MIKFIKDFHIQPIADNSSGGGGEGASAMYAIADDTCTITAADSVVIGSGE